MDKDFYNKSSADSLGWDPSWFGVKHFDHELVEAVERWQTEHGLQADGMVGPMTYRRIWTDRQAHISEYKPKPVSPRPGEKHVVHNGRFLPIAWERVVLWDEPGGLAIKPGRYYDYAGKADRKPTHFVNHWDVCLSSELCTEVLNNRGISVHFCIDNDGTIFQILDTQHGAWHAGDRDGNRMGIGVEVSNAYYPKYQSWYVKHGFGERPTQENGWVHGHRRPPFLDFYPVQVEALLALWKAIHLGVGIPLEYPKTAQGEFDTSVNADVQQGRFHGFCSHYHFSDNKIDCAGLDIPALLKRVADTL